MRRILLVLVAVLIGAGAGVYWLLRVSNRDEERRFERQETELIVSKLVQCELTLHKAGKNLADTVRVMPFDGQRIWLTPGNYFLKCTLSGARIFYPVPLTGYRCGPDEDGSFVVTVRSLPAKSPPRLSETVPEFIYIPSGSFLIGDRLNPRERHYVWVTAFFIAPFEVSNAEFRDFLLAPDGYENRANWTEQGWRWKLNSKSQVTAQMTPTDKEYRRFGRPDVPVTWVTWFEANAFCKWLTRRFPGWLFSLPTDAEWEKAARGPDNFDYALGMAISDAEAGLYNWRKNPDAPTPLFGIEESRHLFRPNRYGLYHMTGNVVEWTQSVDRPYNRDHPFANDERNHDDAVGKRTARGGSWYSAATSYLYIPYRDSFQPEHSTQDIGFRIVVKALP